MGVTQREKDAVYAISDAFVLPLYSVPGKKFEGSMDHDVALLDLVVPMSLKVRDSRFTKTEVVMLIDGPGDLFFAVWSEIVPPATSTSTTPHIHILTCDKSKLLAPVEFPSKTATFTLPKLKAILGPSLAHQNSKSRSVRQWKP